LAMLNYGMMPQAENVYGRLSQLGKVDSALDLRYALARLSSGYQDGAVEVLARARKSKLFGTELTLASLIDVHLAILAKDQKRVDALLDALPKDSQFSRGLLMYSHYLSLLNNPQIILTEDATQDILAGSSEFHEVWSAILKLGLERLAPNPTKLGGSALDQLMQAVVEDPLNDWFNSIGFPGDSDYEGSFAFTGILAAPQQSAEGVIKFTVNKERQLTGTIEIPEEKSVLKFRGEIDPVGRLTGTLEFDNGKSSVIRATLLPAKTVNKLSDKSIPALKFIIDSANPAGVMFIVTGRAKPASYQVSLRKT
jgi:hypothetical protein